MEEHLFWPIHGQDAVKIGWFLDACQKIMYFPCLVCNVFLPVATHEGWLLLKREASNSKTMKEINWKKKTEQSQSSSILSLMFSLLFFHFFKPSFPPSSSRLAYAFEKEKKNGT